MDVRDLVVDPLRNYGIKPQIGTKTVILDFIEVPTVPALRILDTFRVPINGIPADQRKLPAEV